MSASMQIHAQLPLCHALADLAVDALIDEADLSPKPALVDRRGSGAHGDLHLGLMHASALSLWPCFREMAEAAAGFGEIGLPLREALGRIGREGEAAMRVTTAGVNTHRGAIWALGLLVAARALAPHEHDPAPSRPKPDASPCSKTASRHASRTATACRYNAATACAAPVKKPRPASPPCSATACRNCTPAAATVPASRMPGLTPCSRS